MLRLLSAAAILALVGCPKPPAPTAPAVAPTPTPTVSAGALPAPPGAALESIARPRTVPGVAADPATVRLDAPDALTLPELGRWAAGLKEELALAPERVTRLVVTITRSGATRAGTPEADVAWLGLLLPRQSGRGGTPKIDLQERRVKLLHVDGSGRSLKTPTPEARVVIKVGARVLKDWRALDQQVATWPAGTPVVVDVHVHVPAAHAVTALAIVLGRGFSPTIAAPEVPYGAGGLPSLEVATKQAIEEGAKAAPLDPHGLPRLGVRIRADARARWAHLCAVFSAALNARVRRVTLCANAGEVEVDLFARGAQERKGAALLEEYDPKLRRPVAEKPIIVLEEEVEVAKHPPSGETPAGPTSAPDSYVVGLPISATAYAKRFGKERWKAEGGSPATEASVVAALRWLKAQQQPDGRWSAGEGAAYLDPGVTALALLAYLGSGATHRSGPWKRTVNRGLRWLQRRVGQDGSVGYNAKRPALSLVSHALVTEALAEAYGMSRDFTLRRPCDRTVQFAALGYPPGLELKVEKARHVAIVARLLRALRAARQAGLRGIPQAVEQRMLAWLRSKTAPTVPALSERLARGDTPGGAALLALDPSKPGSAHRGLLAAEACFYAGGTRWSTWNAAYTQRLLNRQDRGTGAWQPSGEWFMEGGRVVVTSLNALTLETYYRITRPKRKK